MALVEMHEERYPALATGIIHVPNEGKRTRAGHGILVGLGMRAGVADLLLLRARRGYHGLAMELKAPGNLSGATREQKAFLRQQAAEGWLCCVCDDAEVGWALLVWYMGGTTHLQFRESAPIAHVRWASQL